MLLELNYYQNESLSGPFKYDKHMLHSLKT